MCIQTCKHCQVDASPDCKEIMTNENLQTCLDILEKNSIPTLDLTGGAPAMHPHFRWFVSEAKKRDVEEVIVRSNPIILANKKYHDPPEFSETIKLKWGLLYLTNNQKKRTGNEGRGF